MEKYTLTIIDKDQTILVDAGVDLLTALREKDIYVKSSCGGHASCNDCAIKITAGAENLNAPSFEETQLLGNVFHITKERLACQTKIEGPISIDLSKHNESADAEKLRRKTNKNKKKPVIKVRSKDEIVKINEERDEKRKERKEGQDQWQNHWEKEQDPLAKKKFGGGKHPKTFRTDQLDDDVEAPKDKRDDKKKPERN